MAKNSINSFFTNVILLGVLLVLLYFFFTKYMKGSIDLDSIIGDKSKINFPKTNIKTPPRTKTVKVIPSPAEKKPVVENKPPAPVVVPEKKIEIPKERVEIEGNVKPKPKPKPKKVVVKKPEEKRGEMPEIIEQGPVKSKTIQKEIGGLKSNRLFEVHTSVPESAGWGTQVAAYKEYDNAIRHATVLKKYDFNHVYIYLSPEDTVLAYKVVLGNFLYKVDAKTHKELLKSAHDIDGFLIHMHDVDH